MGSVAAYIFSVICASGICAVVSCFVKPSQITGKLIRIVCGVFVAITLLSPITKLDFSEVMESLSSFQYDAQESVLYGKTISQQAMSEIIIEKTEAYILNKAKIMNITVNVEVKLSDTEPPQPEKILITGSVSPYYKQQIITLIETDLGIAGENIIWN